jgi:hypothetical protein
VRLPITAVGGSVHRRGRVLPPARAATSRRAGACATDGSAMPCPGPVTATDGSAAGRPDSRPRASAGSRPGPRDGHHRAASYQRAPAGGETPRPGALLHGRTGCPEGEATGRARWSRAGDDAHSDCRQSLLQVVRAAHAALCAW